MKTEIYFDEDDTSEKPPVIDCDASVEVSRKDGKKWIELVLQFNGQLNTIPLEALLNEYITFSRNTTRLTNIAEEFERMAKIARASITEKTH